MNWADYTILAILFISVLIGLSRGLISEVLSLVIWVVAFWVAWNFGPVVAGYFEKTVTLPSARVAIGYGLCFITVLMVGALFRFLLTRLIAGTGLGGTDRLLGMMFGLARGALIVSLVVFMLSFTPFPNEGWWRESVMLPQFNGAAAWLGQQLPDNVRGSLHRPDMLDHLPKMPDVKLPSKDDLQKLRDIHIPGQNDHAHPAAATTAATS